MTDQIPVIYVISDALGETAEFVSRAAAAQFNGIKTKIRRVPYVLDETHIDDILEEAVEEQAILVYTLVLTNLRLYIERRAKEKNLITIDILSPLISALADKTGLDPKNIPNVTHRLDEQYFRKVEAVEFAVKYDDGKDPRGLLYADVVLIGVSRTSKTPLSMYLAHKGIKAANIPLVPEVTPPRELYEVPRNKVFGLILSPEKLNQIRSERLKTLGLGASADYANLNRIMEELDYAKQIMKKIGCVIIDTTNKAVEETASVILQKVTINGELRKDG
ncbi:MULTISPECIES: pyruvate, water dikinase regulatory protein [Dehalobacter]|uniref:Putative pyruvate, phosphate dikinase regulatory protein n=1 Tax=Dehalobacter restrictus TaxID=55583 RepID=A0A857DEQ8_9FIRM|nr:MULTISPECIES: pyruvate, water dikinase regulatory protein [Dehalobacter]MCG1025774.1 kinase/pyrophosphorylase [Dehalobacter sp.]MDJ0306398.1 kinase/pyrophosphorylase [Dehalobacter sp.]OCZ51416.1 phosphoenolpyruvate synthase regulatory protein [Dehalobacter sp. TeCB1]QGZ99759.1 pyruvate, phosphate dikinase/phosphoenolpyruvate synthase regulator [Dehalobacter restrictus]